MKKAIFFLLLISTISANAQTAKTTTKTPTSSRSVKHEQKVDSLLSKIDTLLLINNQLLEHLEINTSLKERYKLYQTENIYTFLQLDMDLAMVPGLLSYTQPKTCISSYSLTKPVAKNGMCNGEWKVVNVG